ncbi:MAG: IS1634 family transposase [Bacteroidales bacterium]|nr:IS1634 family transposase [Bacteroidales bacterium]
MFVRKKKNRSGVISVQVIDKSTGKYKMLKTIGSSDDADEIERLVAKGKDWVKARTGNLEIDFSGKRQLTEDILNNIDQINVSGTEHLLGKLYDEIGFDKIDNNLFKKLVISRLSFPASKLKTVDLLLKYHSVNINIQDVYRYLDKLYNTQKEFIQQISYEHTLKVLNNTISVVFYDVTTLYFQIDDEDEIRKRGFSKEGKHQNPQIVLGLLVSVGGYPLSYEIFEGNKFEGHTMLPIIDAFKNKYHLNKLVIIADSGLLSSQNIIELQEKGYEFILGARIKNEKQQIKDKILTLNLKSGESKIIEKEDSLKLIISHSDKRAKKDKHNRERGLQRLEKQIKSGKLTKSNINNRGYNKYLKMEGKVNISIDINKFEEDGQWDGLKGYVTNTNLSKESIIENYGHLWKIEKAFRISKHDLKIRPIYHRLQRRIEAHIAINFTSYKIYKELERQLKEKNADLSPEKAIEIAKTIYSIKINIPNTKESITRTLILNDEQKYLAELFKF